VAKKSSAKKSTKAVSGKKAPAKSVRAGAARSAKKAVKKVAKKAKRVAKKTTVKKAKAPGSARRLKKTPMKKAELNEFKKMLLEKRRDLLGDMTGIEAEALRKDRQDGSGDLSTLPTHPADVGTDNYEQEFTLGLLESEKLLLDKINAALQRIEDRTFGICIGTGKPIAKARLKARPWSRYCIEYARMIEKGLVRPNEGNYPQQAGEDDTGEVLQSEVDQNEQKDHDYQ